MSRQYGDFIRGANEFEITERDIPRNWYNYLWNDRYITFVSQTGAGQAFVEDRLANRIFSLSSRMMYLESSGEHWGITGLPVEEQLDGYSCIHGHGYTKIRTKKNGIESEVCFFVPDGETCEIWVVQLKNTGDRDMKLSLFSYNGHNCDGAYTPQGYNTSHAYYDKELCGIICKGNKNFEGEKYKKHFVYTVMNCEADGYDATENAFIGPYGSLAYPKAQRRGGCTNTDGTGEKLAAALQKNLTLKPGENKTVIFMCGVAFSAEHIAEVRSRFDTAEKCGKCLAEVRKSFREQAEGVSIITPDEKLNEMFPWLKHQSVMGSNWARVRSDGYRDILSDIDCLACVNPKLALERLERILEYQYSNGYAPRSILNGKINDNSFSDNTVGITYAVSSILKELGDTSILERQVKFNDGTQGTIYEHMKRSVDFLYGFRGLHGLIKIWGGDWNDCMNSAGLEGKGVSVWLSLAWLRADKMFAEIARICGRDDEAAEAERRGAEMNALIEAFGWDGEYYLDAYNDDDRKIGSHTNKEGKIYLIPQLWAVLSGISSEERKNAAMDAAEKYLNDPLGTRICEPAYTKYDSGIGYMTIKYPGIHENGGVYLHTVAWKIAADAMLKRADRVEKDIETILPFRNKVVDGRAEPYIMCNSYFGKQTGYRYGTAGQSWRTAAGQWFQKALVNYVYGLMPEMDGLRIDPCLPPSWREAEITKKFRGAVYTIKYKNSGTKVKHIFADGKEISGTILPFCAGKNYNIEVITGE